MKESEVIYSISIEFIPSAWQYRIVTYRAETLLFKNTSTFKRDAFYLPWHSTLHWKIRHYIPYAYRYLYYRYRMLNHKALRTFLVTRDEDCYFYHYFSRHIFIFNGKCNGKSNSPHLTRPVTPYFLACGYDNNGIFPVTKKFNVLCDGPHKTLIFT